jgi:hypothetical protein
MRREPAWGLGLRGDSCLEKEGLRGFMSRRAAAPPASYEA